MIRRLLTMLAALGAGAAVAAAPAVPQHWIGYAQMAGEQFQARLGDPASAAAARLREGESFPASLLVRVWVAPSGQVERVAFVSLGTAALDADLRGLMTARPLSKAPPADMRQPIVLELTLQPSSEASE